MHKKCTYKELLKPYDQTNRFIMDERVFNYSSMRWLYIFIVISNMKCINKAVDSCNRFLIQFKKRRERPNFFMCTTFMLSDHRHIHGLYGYTDAQIID